jgi:hypothetical protein
MIAHEHIRPIRIKEAVLVVVVAIKISLLLWAAETWMDPSLAFIVSLALLVFGMNLVLYITKKSLVSVLFFVLVALLTFNVNDVGVTGIQKVMVFGLAALIFEMTFLYLKMHMHSVPVDMIVGSSLATAAIPLFTAFALAPALAKSFPLSLFNLILIGFSAGLLASVLTFILWHYIHETKFILKLEARLMSLEL